jgi:hypothetical protein
MDEDEMICEALLARYELPNRVRHRVAESTRQKYVWHRRAALAVSVTMWTAAICLVVANILVRTVMSPTSATAASVAQTKCEQTLSELDAEELEDCLARP